MTTGRCLLSALLATIVGCGVTAQAAVYHVRPTGSDANSGLDWSNAKKTVTAALAVAGENDEIWVAAGEYHERIRSRAGTGGVAINVGLYGGFAGTETSREGRDWIGNVTVLDGDAGGSVVTIDAGAKPTFVVDGFRIRNGSAIYGAGISATAAAPTITRNHVLGNVADVGGGIMIWGYEPGPPVTQATIEFNVVQANFANDDGGGIAIVGGSPVVRGNYVRLNGTYGRGGGIGVWVSESVPVARPLIEANSILENAATVGPEGAVIAGGGIFATERNLDDQPIGGVCAPRIRSNLIAANAGVALGGGVMIANAEHESALIVNNTIVANSGSGVGWGNAAPTIVNNIVAFNTWGLDEDIGNPYPETIRFNDVFGNNVHGRATDYNNLSSRTGLDGNVSVDPRLVTFGDGRLHLKADSPCRNAGDDSVVGGTDVDIDQQPRRADAHVDLGADESDGTSWPDVPLRLHVTTAGSDTNDGLTWSAALASVGHAIDLASTGRGGEVWVAEGTYRGHPTLAAWVHVYGGFAGTETALAQRDPGTHLTILDGDEVPPVVNCGQSGYRVARLDGFRITRGGRYYGATTIPPTGRPAGLGGGIRCEVSSPVIANNEITRNSLGDPHNPPEFPARGAGIGLSGSHALITGNTITENEVLARSGHGGAIYADWSLVDLESNVIAFNHAPYGPGMYSLYSRPRLLHNLLEDNEHYYLPPLYFATTWGSSQFDTCFELELDSNTFYRNTAGTGGAAYISFPREGGLIVNNLFRANRAYNRQTMQGGEGGALLLMTHPDATGDVLISGNTFIDNVATDWLSGEQGGAIAILPYSDRAIVANNVMAFNSSGIYRRSGATFSFAVRNNVMWNGASNYLNVSPGAGDLVADPLFVDRSGGNYRLQATSPGVDTGGDADAALPSDHDGAPRVQDGDGDGTATVDRGAFELSPDTDHDGIADWQDPDDDNDGVVDAADCAPLDPLVWSPPVAPNDVRVGAGQPPLVTWGAQAPGTRYDLAGGSVLALRSSGYASAACEADDIAANSWSDARNVAPGDAGWLLVRAGNVCGVGSWGSGSGGAPRSITACP